MSKSEKRAYGSGSLLTVGRMWYGQWRVRGRLVKRRIGPQRERGTREGLTRAQAERELQRMIGQDQQPAPRERVTVGVAGARYLRALTALGRRRSTLTDYASYLNIHLEPFFGDTPLDAIGEELVDEFIAETLAEGKAPKSVRNYVGLLHSIFKYAEKKGWARANPCRLVDLPQASAGDPDIRFLDQAELDAVLRAARDDQLGEFDRTLWLVAAMSGLRQGELLALRWRDIDWVARKIRVRQNYVRGEFGKPKSKRSSRAVPLGTRAAQALEQHFQRAAYQGDDDLVFCHPQTGKPFDRSKARKRFVAVVKRAKVRHVRFHDLRHTFGTRMAAAGVPLRTIQEWMGHRDSKTTQIYADYQPSDQESEAVDRAFELGINFGINLSETDPTSEGPKPHNQAESEGS